MHNARRSYDVISIFQYGGHRVGNLLPASVLLMALVQECKYLPEHQISMRSQSTAKLFLLPVCENERPPYWNSTSGFDFDLFIITGMAFCIGVANSQQSYSSYLFIYQDGCPQPY